MDGADGRRAKSSRSQREAIKMLTVGKDRRFYPSIRIKGNDMCDCKSYNKQVGTVEERILYPKFYTDGRSVCVDECIADVVLHLWKRGIMTWNSCCGHNGLFGRPMIIIGENASIATVKYYRAIIKEIDNREFDILSWTLLRHSDGENTPGYEYDINRELNAEEFTYQQ